MEMEAGTAVCINPGPENWYEFTSAQEKEKRGLKGFFTKRTVCIPSTLEEYPAWHCPHCRKVLLWAHSKE